MAGSWIDSAARKPTPAIGDDGMHRDAILAMPAGEREAAIAELARARRCVLRYGYEHADEILPILGLSPLTDDERAAGPLPKPEPAPVRPAAAPKPRRRRRKPRRAGTYKQCVGCRSTKPADEFPPRSYRCHICQAYEAEKSRDVGDPPPVTPEQAAANLAALAAAVE